VGMKQPDRFFILRDVMAAVAGPHIDAEQIAYFGSLKNPV